jgi:RNA polymerase sigma factor (sigma-70 family)
LDLDICLNSISAQEKEILVKLFFHGEKQSELAKKYGLKQSAIAHIKGKAIKKMQKMVKNG